jgi:hypothetical protein
MTEEKPVKHWTTSRPWAEAEAHVKKIEGLYGVPMHEGHVNLRWLSTKCGLDATYFGGARHRGVVYITKLEALRKFVRAVVANGGIKAPDLPLLGLDWKPPSSPMLASLEGVPTKPRYFLLRLDPGGSMTVADVDMQVELSLPDGRYVAYKVS